jgi:REP element-mobilizing transposase RayT
MYRNDAGEMVHQQWQKLTERFPNIELDEFIVMPDHFHGIINIVGATTNGNQTELDVERPQGSPPRSITQKTVSDFLDAFKSITTVEYIRGIKKSGWKPFNRKLWQRDFFDRIIRTAQSYKNISKYISENPAKWRGPTP